MRPATLRAAGGPAVPAPAQAGGGPATDGGAPDQHGGAPGQHGGAPGQHGGAAGQRVPLGESRDWMQGGEIFLAAQLAALARSSVSAPSLLPGWTRAHVISHLAGNAHGLLNLLAWARTGVETPMYPSPQARRDAIDQGARLPAAALLGETGASSAALTAAVAQLPEPAWRNTVRSALGRAIPASEVPWMRSREVWIHSVDLDAGAWFDAFPAALVDRLLAEVAGLLGARAECPAVTLAPDDRARAWFLGPAQSPVTVSGPAADLLGWATGRSRRGLPAAITSREPLPRLPPWL